MKAKIALGQYCGEKRVVWAEVTERFALHPNIDCGRPWTVSVYPSGKRVLNFESEEEGRDFIKEVFPWRYYFSDVPGKRPLDAPEGLKDILAKYMRIRRGSKEAVS